MSLVPASNKAEWHLTYGCDLACRNCNRASFLREPHTPDMTLEDAREFCRQAEELQWYPAIILIGGEPCLHEDFFGFVELALDFMRRHRGAPGAADYVQLWSNQTSAESKARAAEAERRGVSLCNETTKDHSMVLERDDIYVSPRDVGFGQRPPCFSHASILCGISVDHEGYMPCAMAGMIDALLKLGLRTKRLADLFDEEIVADTTAKMCEHCGHNVSFSGLPDATIAEWREKVDATPRRFASHMTPTWMKAFEGRR
jgi:hypothetical protein